MSNSTNKYNYTKNDDAPKHCRHPHLQEGPQGEKICVNCGRTVYPGNNINKSKNAESGNT